MKYFVLKLIFENINFKNYRLYNFLTAYNIWLKQAI